MRAGDLKPCALCGKGIMHTGVPLFYRVTIERMGVDLNGVHQAAGMETFFRGNVAIARVFSDPVIAKPVGDKGTALVCESCSMEPHLIARLAEAAEHTKPQPDPLGEALNSGDGVYRP